MQKQLKEIPKQNSRFLARTFHQALIPGILSLLSGNLTLVVDGVIVGQCIGSAGLTSVNLCMPIFLAICVFGVWIAAGTAIFSAKELGAGNGAQGNKYCHISMTFSTGASIILTVLGFLFLKPLAQMLCPDESLLPMVYDYAWTAVISTAPKLLIYIPFWYLRLDGKNRSITVMMAILGFGNIALDFWFMLGLNLGIWGAGMASFISYVAAVIYGMVCLFYKHRNFTLGFALPDSFRQLKAMVATGSPSAMHNLFKTLRVLTINAVLMAYGGSLTVAVFTAVTGVAYFSECILIGVPQAASAMLGSFAGDQDTASIRLIMKHQLQVGLKMNVVFGIIIIAGAGLISSAYGLNVAFYTPMLCLACSIFPGLICAVFTKYYNTIGLNQWANLIVFCRVFLFPILFLLVCIRTSLPVWLFFPAGELSTMVLWLIIFWLKYRKDPERSCFLRLKHADPREVICSSIEGDSEKICKLSEGVLDFCTQQGMNSKAAMRLSLAIEELLTVISEENKGKNLFCDFRLRVTDAGYVMTLRYSGKNFNPLSHSEDEADCFLGMKMLEKLLPVKDYQNISGMNVLRITV